MNLSDTNNLLQAQSLEVISEPCCLLPNLSPNGTQSQQNNRNKFKPDWNQV